MARRDFRLPDLGEGLEDAEVVRWLVREGDEVSLNQPLVEVDTAKALVEVPSPFAGKVIQLHASEGAVVRVGEALVSFEVAEGAETPAEPSRRSVLVGYGVEAESKPKRRRRLSGAKPDQTAAPTETPAEAAKVSAAPPVRRLASELRVDLALISGTGVGGRITREDVLAASGEKVGVEPSASGTDGDRIALKGIRRRIAEKMTRSASEIPHVTTFLTFDAWEVLELRRDLTGDVKVTPLAVVAKAFVSILAKHPKLNATFDSSSQEIVLSTRCNLGVATDTERGLIVPVVIDAGTKSISQIAEEIGRLSRSAREGTLTPADLVGGTVTISNVGSFGAEFGTPIINHPETCILALGVIEERPAVLDGQLTVRPQAVMSLSFDHRVIDGAEAGRALLDLRELLQSPADLRAL